MSAVILEKKRSAGKDSHGTQSWNDEVQQSAWLLDYDRRSMLDCADTFQNLAAVMGEMNWELEQGKTPDDREELLRRRQAMESRKQYAAHMRQMAGMLQSVADTSVQLIRLGGRQEKQIVRALAGEGIVVEDIYLLPGKRGQAADHDICPPDKEQKHDGRGNCRVFVGADGYPAGAAEEESIFCRRRIRESVF